MPDPIADFDERVLELKAKGIRNLVIAVEMETTENEVLASLDRSARCINERHRLHARIAGIALIEKMMGVALEPPAHQAG